MDYECHSVALWLLDSAGNDNWYGPIPILWWDIPIDGNGFADFDKSPRDSATSSSHELP